MPINYSDLGYDSLLQKQGYAPNFVGTQNLNYIEGLDSSQIITAGKIQSASGKFFIDFDNEEMFLPEQTVQTGQINYNSRMIKAVVSQTGGGDFSDIQQAIDYVNRQGGGLIYIKSGTYTLTGSLTLYTQIQLEGDGPGKTIINCNNHDYNISLVGSMVDFSTLMAGDSTALQNVKIKNLEIRNSTNANGSINLQYVRGAEIDHVLFTSNTLDVLLTGCVPGKVIHCNSFNSTNSIKLSGGCSIAQLNYISNCTVGIQLLSNGGCVADHNFIAGANRGIRCLGGADQKVTHNELSDIVLVGIEVSLSGTTPNGVNITDNTIQTGHPGTYGIALINATNSKVSNNHVENSYTYGIYLEDADDCEITSNSCRADTIGIYIETTSDRNIIGLNNVRTCTTPIQNNGTNTTLSANITA